MWYTYLFTTTTYFAPLLQYNQLSLTTRAKLGRSDPIDPETFLPNKESKQQQQQQHHHHHHQQQQQQHHQQQQQHAVLFV